MNAINTIQQILVHDIQPFLLQHDFHAKRDYFIRLKEGRQDILKVLYQRGNQPRHASFSFAIGFIAPATYAQLTGKKQPFIFAKRILFYVPMGVLLCANENLIAGFDYTYELYSEQEHYDALPYDVYQQARPDMTKVEFDAIEQLYEQLQQRYDHTSGHLLASAIKEDLTQIIDFFDQLPPDQDILKTFQKEPPKNRLEELLYHSFEDYASQHGQVEVAIGLRMQLNQVIAQRRDL